MQTRDDRWACSASLLIYCLPFLTLFFNYKLPPRLWMFCFASQSDGHGVSSVTVTVWHCRPGENTQNPHPNRNAELGTDLSVSLLPKLDDQTQISLGFIQPSDYVIHIPSLPSREAFPWGAGNEEGWGTLNSSDLSLTHRSSLFITTQTWGNG